MATLRFEIETDGVWTPSELDEVATDFASWISDIDGDAKLGTEDVTIVDDNVDNSSEDQKIEAKAIELLKTGKFTLTIDMEKGGTVNLDGFTFPEIEL